MEMVWYEAEMWRVKAAERRRLINVFQKQGSSDMDGINQ